MGIGGFLLKKAADVAGTIGVLAAGEKLEKKHGKNTIMNG